MYCPIQPALHANKAKTSSAKERYWNELYKKRETFKHFAKVTDVNYCQATNDVAVTSSTRVILYDSSCNVKKTFSRFKDVAYSGTLRADGKLLVAGSHDGHVRLFDTDSKSMLRLLQGHSAAAHVAGFINENTLFSASDDTEAFTWDLASGKQGATFRGHTDHIRCGKPMGSTLVTGSYDHTVKLWDMRLAEAVSSYVHPGPVECVVPGPAGGIVLTSSDNTVRIWDTLTNTLRSEFSAHLKQITGMCVSRDHLITCSLDQFVKIYSLDSFEVIASIKMPQPALSIDTCSTGFAVGMVDGSVSICSKDVGIKELEEPLSLLDRDFKLSWGMQKVVQKTASTKIEHVIEHQQKKQKLKSYDVLLKRFQHRAALDAAIENGRPAVIAAVIIELKLRNVLHKAVDGRDVEDIEPMLRIIRKHVTNPYYATELLDLANAILNVYSTSVALSASNGLVQLLKEVKGVIHTELVAQRELTRVRGSIDLLLSASTSVSSNVQ